MATSILRNVHYQKLHRFYVVLNSQQNASRFLRRETVPPVCASLRFCSNTPVDESESTTAKNERKESEKTIQMPRTSASYLNPKINEIAEKTGASLKLADQTESGEKIPVIITATSPENIQKAVKEINEVLQKHLAELRSAQPVGERLEELIYIPRDKAGFLMGENSSSILDIQNETATQIKVMSDLQDEQILLVLTGTGQDNIKEAMNMIKQLVLQRNKKTIKLDHPPFDEFLNVVKKLQKTGTRINLGKEEDNDVAVISARTQKELEDAEAKLQECMNSVRSRRFTFKTDNGAWSRFIGKNHGNIKELRQRLQEVDPSLLLNTALNEDKNVTAVYLFGKTDIDGDKFQKGVSMVIKDMKKNEKIFENSKQPRQRFNRMKFEFKTQNPEVLKFFIGKQGSNINLLKRQLQKVNPSIDINIGAKDAVRLLYPNDLEADKLKEVESMINQEMNQAEKTAEKSKQPRQRWNTMELEFETQNPGALKVFIGKQGSNINSLSRELEVLDPAINIKIGENGTVQLVYPNDLEADKLKEAESLVRQNMEQTIQFLGANQSQPKGRRRKSTVRKISFEAANTEVWNMLIGRNYNNINSINEKVMEIDPSLRCHWTKPNVILVAEGSIDEDKFEEAKSLINHSIEMIHKYLELFLTEVKDEKSGKHQIFKLKADKPDRAWRVLIGKGGHNFFRIVQSVKKIDSSLNLQIIRSDVSSYESIILWSKENTGDEKFTAAISLVNKEIEMIEKSSAAEAEKESAKKKTFEFETHGSQALSHFVGARGSNIKAILQELRMLNPKLSLQQKGDSAIQLLYPENMNQLDLEDATAIVEKEVKRIKEFLAIFTTDVEDKLRGKHRIFKFDTDNNEEAWNRLIGKDGFYIKRLVRSIENEFPSLSLSIVNPESSRRDSLILWAKENVEDEQFEIAASMIDDVFKAVEISMTESNQDQARTGAFKTMTFEFENPRERVVRYFIGLKGTNIHELEDELHAIDGGFQVKVLKDMRVQLIYPSDVDEISLGMAEAMVKKNMNDVEKGKGLSIHRWTKTLEMDHGTIDKIIGPGSSNIIKLRAKIQRADPSAEIFADPIKETITLYGSDRYYNHVNELVSKEVSNFRKSRFIEPVKRGEFEGLDRHLDPLSASKQDYEEEIGLTERMRNILMDPETMKLKKIQHLAIKRGKGVTIQETLQSIRLRASTKEDLEEFSKMIHEAVTDESGKFTKVIKITPSIWVALMEGKGQEVQDKYGIRLLTFKPNTGDSDSLEILYENPEQLETVLSEVRGLHTSNVLSHQLRVRSEEYKQLLTQQDEVLRDIQTQANCFIDIDDVKEERGGSSGVVSIFAKSRLDLDVAIRKINEFVGYTVPNFKKKSVREPKEKNGKKSSLESRELDFLFTEALDKTEISNTQYINIPEDFSFTSMESTNIWTKEDLKKPSRQDTPDNLYYQLLRERKENVLAHRPPYNGFEEMIKLTNEGKMWHYPIDNEQGMDEEKAVSFAEHVFFDDMLEEFPKSGPIRNYMEQVTVGLSQNPHLTVEEKREHIAWYKNYFQGKAETLKDFFGETGELRDFLSKENLKENTESLND